MDKSDSGQMIIISFIFNNCFFLGRVVGPRPGTMSARLEHILDERPDCNI